MNKKVLINEIIDLYDENQRLKELLKPQQIKDSCISVEELEVKHAKDAILEELLIKGLQNYRSLFSCNSCKVFDEDTREFIDFDTWYKTLEFDTWYMKNLPKGMTDLYTLKEIKDIFKPYIKYRYTEISNEKKGELMRAGKEGKDGTNN